MLVCVFLGRTCTRDRGCAVHPVFPRILCFRGVRKLSANLEQCVLRDREPVFERRCGPHVSTSLRGALATKQSTPASLPRDGLLRGACHRAGIRATRWLAMTLSR